MVGNTASIYGSYMYPASASPRYIAGGTANTVICLLVAAVAAVLRWVHVRENRKLEAAEREREQEVDAGGAAAEGGQDGKAEGGERRAAPGFRYVY